MRLSYNDKHLELMAWAEEVAQLSREQQRAFLTDAVRLLRESYLLHAGLGEISCLWGEEAKFCRNFAPFIGNQNIESLVAEAESAMAQIRQNGNPTIVFTYFALSVSKMIKKFVIMARAIILTGGNVGDVKTRLQNAQRLINQHAGPVMRCSHRYKSRAWGFDAEEEFFQPGPRGGYRPDARTVARRFTGDRAGTGARPRGRTVAQAKDRCPIYVAPDRHRHTLLRRPRDSHRAADRFPIR